MPIYLYSCEIHGEFEIWHSIAEPAHTAHMVDAEDGMGHVCQGPIKRLIPRTAGFVMEPNGVYQHVQGPPRIDPKTRRMAEEKLTKREYEKRDTSLREELMSVRNKALVAN